MAKNNYSWKTSLPAYIENSEGKDMQEKLILHVMKQNGNKITLLEVRDFLKSQFKIMLPQSTISGRMNDLRNKGLVDYYGDMRSYKDRLRKVFEVVNGNTKKRLSIQKGMKVIVKYKPIFPVSLKQYKSKVVIKMSDDETWESKDMKTWAKKKKTPKKRKQFARSIK